MGYSSNPEMVRVDFFKQSGKWYTTEAVEWTGGWPGSAPIHKAFAKSLRDHFSKEKNPKRLSDMDAICLHPYYEYEHPIQLKNGSWLTYEE